MKKSLAKFLSIFLKVIITVPVICFLFFLTLSNRSEFLHLTWSPVAGKIEISAPVVLFVTIVAGFIWGSLILWSNTLPLRAEHRLARKQIASLQNQLEVLRAEIERLNKAQAAASPQALPQPRMPAPRIASPEIL